MIYLFSIFSLTLSILSETEEQKYHVIFRWDDSVELVRPIPPYQIRIFFWGHTTESPVAMFRSIHGKEGSFFVFRTELHSMYSSDETSADDSAKNVKNGGKIAWVAREYLHYNPDTFYNRFEPIPPIEVDQYEMIVYETGQMSKSLLLMNDADFMETIR